MLSPKGLPDTLATLDGRTVEQNVPRRTDHVLWNRRRLTDGPLAHATKDGKGPHEHHDERHPETSIVHNHSFFSGCQLCVLALPASADEKSDVALTLSFQEPPDAAGSLGLAASVR